MQRRSKPTSFAQSMRDWALLVATFLFLVPSPKAPKRQPIRIRRDR
jgi:hypothetical protein